MDDPLPLQVIEEARVQRFDPALGEVLETNRTDLELFLANWKAAKMDPDAVGASEEETRLAAFHKSRGSIIQHCQSIKRDLRCMTVTIEALQQAGGLKMDGTKFLQVPLANPDVPIGVLITDKQLQLQSAANFLMRAAQDLPAILTPAVETFRELDALGARFPITVGRDYISQKTIPTIATFLRSTLEIVLGSDESGQLVWEISRPVFLTLSGRAIVPNLANPYSEFVCRVAVDALFGCLKRELVSASVDYATEESSPSFAFTVGGETLEFSEATSPVDPLDICPPYLPALAGSMFDARPRPFAALRECLETRHLIQTVGRLILNTFLSCDFCKVTTFSEKLTAMWQIEALYSSPAGRSGSRPTELIVAYITNGKVALSDTSGALACRSIDPEVENVEAVVKKWCTDQYWRLFTITVAAVAGRFGFQVDLERHLTVHCEDERTVQFQGHFAERTEIRAIVKQFDRDLYLRWLDLPVTSHYHRLSYLFFYPFFR
jgi:hypothetical protein